MLLTGGREREKLIENCDAIRLSSTAAHFLFRLAVSPGMLALGLKPGSGVELLNATKSQ